MFASLAAGMFSAFIIQILLARYLDPGSFSEMAVFSNVLAVMAVPGLSIQLHTAAGCTSSSSIDRESSSLFTQRMAKSLRFSRLISGIVVLLMPIWVMWLDLSLLAVLALVLYSIPVVMEPLFIGVLQAEEAFGKIGITSSVQAGGKTLAVSVGIFLGFSAGQFALFITLAATCGGLVAALFSRRSELPLVNYSSKRFLGRLLLLLLFWMYATADVYLARLFLPTAVAGQYAVGSLLSKLVIVVAMTVNQVDFPRLIQEQQSKPHPSFSRSATLPVLAAVAISVAMPISIPLLFGNGYYSPTLVLIPFAVLPLGLALFSLYALIALNPERRRAFLLQVSFLYLMQISLARVAATSILTLVMISVLTNLIFLFCLDREIRIRPLTR